MGENTYYTDDDFWQKINLYAKLAGRKVTEKALCLYYAAADPKTPAWAKSVIWGALMYFICPIDAIPDAVPIVGFSDDFGVLVCALITVNAHITEKIEKQAVEKMKEWFERET